MDFSQLAILLSTAVVFGIIAKYLKQPLILAYILAGFTLSLFGIVQESPQLEALGQIGVTLLLFLLGLELDINELPLFGKVAFLAGAGQILFTFIVAFPLLTLLNVGLLPALYISTALTFSSTIIIVKLLSEKKDLRSLYGRLSIGILLVQDLVAILTLVFLSSMGVGESTFLQIAAVFIKAVILMIALWILSKRILPYIFETFAAGNSELLFITSIAWALGVATFVAGPLGFNLEIGGFLAGVAISNLPEHLQIASRTKPLRDFFLVLFFLLLGIQITLNRNILPLIPFLIALTAFVVFIKPMIILIVLGILGYKKRTSFLAAISLAQISEFSLILLAVGLRLGHVEGKYVSLIVLVGVISMAISTYYIHKADLIYKKVIKYLKYFERRHTLEDAYQEEKKLDEHIVLVGSDRTGKAIANYLFRKSISFVIVDFNPAVYKHFTAQKFPVIFGDINDPDILEAAQIEKARMVITTFSQFDDNTTLLEYVKNHKFKVPILMTAATREEALKLYSKGATFVIVPDIVAGEYVRHLFDIYGLGELALVKLGKSHFNRLMYR